MKDEKSQEKAVANRRNFLKLAGLGTAGAVASAATAVTASAAEPENAGPESGSYRETDYVKRVYELSRF